MLDGNAIVMELDGCLSGSAGIVAHTDIYIRNCKISSCYQNHDVVLIRTRFSYLCTYVHYCSKPNRF